MEEISYKDLVNRHIKLMDENIEIMDKYIKLENKYYALLLNIRNHELKLIDEFNKTLTKDNDYNFESHLHYRNGLRFTLDYIQKEKDNGTI